MLAVALAQFVVRAGAMLQVGSDYVVAVVRLRSHSSPCLSSLLVAAISNAFCCLSFIVNLAFLRRLAHNNFARLQRRRALIADPITVSASPLVCIIYVAIFANFRYLLIRNGYAV